MGVIDHKVMNQYQSAWRKRVDCASRQDAHVIVADRAPQIGHQNYVVSGRPLGGNGISTEVHDPDFDSGA